MGLTKKNGGMVGGSASKNLEVGGGKVLTTPLTLKLQELTDVCSVLEPEVDHPQDFKAGILLVDDKPENLLALEKLLEAPDVEIVKASSGNEALSLILEREFALILLDVQMPGMDGFETAELIQSNKDTRHIPIIFVTAISKEQKHVFRGYEAGAVDYLFKPLDPYILKGKVRTFLELHRQRLTLEHMNRILKKSNQKILEQQKSVIEEERLKVLLQMAGATAHELRQPLTALLGNIELLRMFSHAPEKQDKILSQIEEAGERVAEIVEMIQTIRRDETKAYAGNIAIINLEQETKVLYVEDRDADYNSITQSLSSNPRLKIFRAYGVGDGMEILQAQDPDLVLLDFYLSDGTGLDFLAEMEKAGEDAPVVVISGQGDEMVAAQMIQAGAFDYISKSRADAATLSRTIATALEKARLRKETRLAQEKIVDMSITDELTGLSNRRYFNEVVDIEVQKARNNGSPLTLCMMDLDHFKNVNDTYGHLTGDKVLAETGALLKQGFRSHDMIFRYGGEEFAVILPDTDLEHAKRACERFRESVQEHVMDAKVKQVKITISIGIANMPGEQIMEAGELIDAADHALYRAKELGRNRVEAP
ncbi:diguanylate cyclase [Desulfatibacillum aliphaticivorans]|uniref:Response regulator receiver modulated diguanylate cyclase n=1 Tax=Desulfatibacillum aliphaticivorans TaxID=218208 RepID=B8FL29_DESAL|nr:diguanylate cyclase [Desulfatibacillum aliphaticivorans]ACL04664.1 response regulator receiver modulated diguanylate cyclase [Desulfatibacillum aliphaticivorans]